MPGAERVVAATRRWGRRRRATLSLAALLFVAYVVQQLVRAWFGFPTMVYWFAATADPTPGWALAVLAHQSPGHLLENVLVLVLVGSYAEEVLSTTECLFVFVVGGLAGNAAQVGSYLAVDVTGGAVGASAAVLGLVTFHAVRSLRTTLGGGDQRFVSRYWGFVGLLAVAVLLTNDFYPGLTLWPDTAEYAHLTGMGVGVGGALTHPRAVQS